MAHRFIRLPAILAGILLSCMAITARSAEFKLNGHTFTLPDGFTLAMQCFTSSEFYTKNENLISSP